MKKPLGDLLLLAGIITASLAAAESRRVSRAAPVDDGLLLQGELLLLQRADAKFCRRAGASSALFSARVHALQCQRPSRMAQHSARIPRVRDQRSSLQRVGTSGAILGRAHGDGHPALRPTRRACEP